MKKSLDMKLNSPADLESLRQQIQSRRDPKKPVITVCGGTGCLAYDSNEVGTAIRQEVEKRDLKDKVEVRTIGFVEMLFGAERLSFASSRARSSSLLNGFLT